MKLNEVSDYEERTVGQQVMAFTSYLVNLQKIDGAPVDDFKKIGAALFKQGFKYYDTEFHQLPDEGGVYEVKFPSWHSKDDIKRGSIYLHHYRWTKGVKYEYAKTLSTNEIMLWTVPLLKKMMYDHAKRERS